MLILLVKWPSAYVNIARLQRQVEKGADEHRHVCMTRERALRVSDI